MDGNSNKYDKSLKFFNDTWFGSKRDSNGTANTNVNLDSDKEIDLPVTVNIQYFNTEDTSKITTTQSYEGTIKALQSKVNSNEILVDSSSSLGNDFTIETPVGEYSETSISNVIEWSRNYPSMTIQPIDIALLKDFQSYPANRFMILRRFPDHATHNLFAMKNIRPISTMVGYYDLLETPIKVGMGEKWTTFNDTFFSVFQDIIGIQFDSIPGLERIVTTGKNSPFAQDFMYKIGEKLGFIGIESPYGQANLIHESAVRDVSGEDLHTGLTTDFKFTFETVYEYRKIPGEDGMKLLKKIINNARRMGTSDAVFLAGDKGMKRATGFFNALKSGSMTEIINELINAIKETATDTLNLLKGLFDAQGDNSSEDGNNNNTTNSDLSSNSNPVFNLLRGLDKGLGALAKARYVRYQWKIKGVLGAISGAHTAPWHLTLGNPKKPWFSMGNLVLENISIEPTGEMMFDDFPSEWKVVATLKNGRAMGGQEIFKCFNPGSTREYANKDSLARIINVRVPEGSTVYIGGGLEIPPNATSKPSEEIQKNDVQNNPDTIDPTNGVISDFAKT